MLRVAAAIGSAAIIVSTASWAHFGQVWKGVFISRAGDLGAVSRLRYPKCVYYLR